MQINMHGSVFCNNFELEIVAAYKYLGLIVDSTQSSPSSMLSARIEKAMHAFYKIKNHARLLGLFNRRVRI